MSKNDKPESACGPDCGCAPSAMPRRRFLALSGASLIAASFGSLPVMAGPFESSDFAKLVPPDKKLRPEWVRSLTARGLRTVYTKKRGELRFIGMPVGGLGCGTLYLGGDGKLWAWDIFNQNQEGILPRSGAWTDFSGHKGTVSPRDGASYVDPHEQQSPLEQGFALKIGDVVRPLDTRGWLNISFGGEYPLGRVAYSDPASPASVTLTAYSPFIPLNAEDSGLPATICEFTIKNGSAQTIEAQIGGWLENACSLYSAQVGSGSRLNTARGVPGATLVASRFDRAAPPRRAGAPSDILIDDFEHDGYGQWAVEGTAFGKGPVLRTEIPSYQGDVGGEGKRVVNSHASAPGDKSEDKDKQTGKITSPPFVLQRNYVMFSIGGGDNIEEVGLRLLVDGKTVRRATGHKDNAMRRAVLDVAQFAGKQARIEIYDSGTGGWGNIGVDQIVQTDDPHVEPLPESGTDFGTMALAVLGYGVGKAAVTPETIFAVPSSSQARGAVGEKLVGGLTKAVTLAPGEERTVTFIAAWHFPNSGLNVPDAKTGNHYAKRFTDASAVAAYVAKNYGRLSRDTTLWHETWYDSTLPFWFLDRTFSNTSILATTTSHRFGSGRFWGWEGVGCCEGTCTHVWHYAQTVARIFPELERDTRERVDFGVALDTKSGQIGFRGENTGPAVDGQCGRVLSVYREHQMSADGAFLKRLWPKVKEAMGFLFQHDTDSDGLLDGAQENTLDAAWFGKIAWISSLYLGALRASEEMAREVGDARFAHLCATKFAQTKRALETQLFNGEYFIQRPDPKHEKSLGTYAACHIDQVHGQSWAWQVGLGRIIDRHKTVSALQSLFKYNFAPDIGPFRRKHTSGRPYALAGDAGLLMATNPKSGAPAFGGAADWQTQYFNECMSGFEHQAASHMIAEGLVLEGLAVTRAIHDRYHARHRNPYNEIECSDHYARAMASYGSFVSACGFTYHGPKGHLGFAPRLTPEDFRAAFTAAEGWGTFSQKRDDAQLTAEVRLKHGRLRLKTLALAGDYTSALANAAGKAVPCTIAIQGDSVLVTFAADVVLRAGQRLTLLLA